ncbi:MAG: cupin domain-containing protein [Bacteroidota bacterium]
MKKSIVLILLMTVLYVLNHQSKAGLNEDNSLSRAVDQPADTLNIDMVKTSPGQARVLTENKHVRVVEYTIKPGEKDVWHTHPPRSSYVISGGTVKVYTVNGEPKVSEVKTGTSSWAGFGAKHYVENVGTTVIKIILTEIKSAK